MNTAFKIISVLAILSLIIFGLYFILSSDTAVDSFKFVTEKFSSKEINTILVETQGWSLNKDDLTKISFKIPAGWYNNQDLSYSQFLVPASKKENVIYNQITISRHQGIMYPTYYDLDLFKKIDALEKGQELIITTNGFSPITYHKLNSGKILSGENYVFFNITDASKNTTLTQGYIWHNNQLIILTLNNGDINGVETLEKVIRSVQTP